MDRYCPYFSLMMLKRFGVLGEDQSEMESLVKLQREERWKLLSVCPKAWCGVGDAVVDSGMGLVMVF